MEEAARQSGIEMSEVYQYITERAASCDTLNFQLRLVGQGAIRNALTKLAELASGSAREGKDFESTDLQAAKALARFGLDALKLSKTGLSEKDTDSEVQKDLFDLAHKSPWKLRDVE